MRFKILTGVIVATTLGACGKGGGGSSEPDGPGKAFAAAVNSADKEGVKAVHPSDELLKKSIECESPKVFERVTRSREGLAAELDKDLKGVTLEWVGQELRDEKTLKAGESDDGCKALVDVTMARAKWKFKLTKDGKTEEEGEGVRLVKLGDAGWFLLSM